MKGRKNDLANNEMNVATDYHVGIDHIGFAQKKNKDGKTISLASIDQITMLRRNTNAQLNGKLKFIYKENIKN